ncbi:MAG: hypothetical protein PHY08_03070 [Candidatus Cloacimonetes bacterium]|nr:hypothetical protein [Candidatus Cloacimonadota bacterium]MDD4155534.1 hypothetical protein [Candidatus Cloacimonadota bacterium]
MIFLLMFGTLIIALLTSFLIIQFFKTPIKKILFRIINDDLYTAWHKYMLFAIYVVGVSSGVQIWKLERYLNPNTVNPETTEYIQLNLARWVLEMYRALIGTLTGLAWLLLVFFIICLVIIAFKKR